MASASEPSHGSPSGTIGTPQSRLPPAARLDSGYLTQSTGKMKHPRLPDPTTPSRVFGPTGPAQSWTPLREGGPHVSRKLFVPVELTSNDDSVEDTPRFSRPSSLSPMPSDETYVDTDANASWRDTTVRRTKQNGHVNGAESSPIAESTLIVPNGAPASPREGCDAARANEPVASTASQPERPVATSPYGLETYPLQTPPLCQTCGHQGRRVRVTANESWYPQGRFKYVCRQRRTVCTAVRESDNPGSSFLCWDDDWNTDESICCFCDLPARWDVVRTRSGKGGPAYVGSGFWRCQKGAVRGRCRYFSRDRDGYWGHEDDWDMWWPQSFDDIRAVGEA